MRAGSNPRAHLAARPRPGDAPPPPSGAPAPPAGVNPRPAFRRGSHVRSESQLGGVDVSVLGGAPISLVGIGGRDGPSRGGPVKMAAALRQSLGPQQVRVAN